MSRAGLAWNAGSDFRKFGYSCGAGDGKIRNRITSSRALSAAKEKAQ